ncbi:MAG: F0F1 ATP synthase subunit epsilon [Nitrospirae bacterium]|nr:F0F1 ATP synthase subunit epsilon [Nitrospirota bacterium]MBA3071361.1 F0F1 ATP synthase subunit epsilon [Nitrospirota bacterium]
MENKILLEIVTPHGLIYSGEVDEVTANGSEGEFCVLPGHAPYVTTLKVGMLTCKTGKEPVIFFVNWGYAEVGPDKVLILADSAERSEEIDVDRAKEAMKRAEERLKKIEDIDFHRAEASLERAVTRIQISQMRIPK